MMMMMKLQPCRVRERQGEIHVKLQVGTCRYMFTIRYSVFP